MLDGLEFLLDDCYGWIDLQLPTGALTLVRTPLASFPFAGIFGLDARTALIGIFWYFLLIHTKS